MVAVNGNLLQVIGGKQGIQSKTDAKEGNTLNGDFLMALFAAADGHQTINQDNPEQQQFATEEQQDPLAQLITMLFTTGIKSNQLQLQQLKEQLPNEDVILIDKLENLLLQPQIQLTSVLKDEQQKLIDQLQNIKSPNIQQSLATVNNILKNQQVGAELLKPQSKVVTEELTGIQPKAASAELAGLQPKVAAAELTSLQPKAASAELIGIQPKVASAELAGLQPKVAAAELTSLQPKVVTEELTGVQPKVAKAELSNLQPKTFNPDNKVILPKQVNELITSELKQQTADVIVKVNNLAAEMPKVSSTNKGSTEVQPVESDKVKQEISITSQFSKSITERSVEQVTQQVVKNADVSVQSTGKLTVNQQITGSESFTTVMQNKVTTMDSKVEFVQPEQLAGKLLGMVKEMTTKQQPNQTTMHLKLNPEHLGEVTVRLTYNRGELNAQFYAATTHGKEALEAALPQMRDALFQQQVKLNEATVYLNSGSGNQWLGGRQGNQGGNRGRGQGGYYSSNGLQPKVSVVPLNGNRIVDDGLNILV